MRRKERARIIIQRASAIAAVAVFVLWVASVWWDVLWLPSRGYLVGFQSGSLVGIGFQPGSPFYGPTGFEIRGPGFGIPKDPNPRQWWLSRWSTPTESGVYVPLWVFEIPTLALAAALWRRNTKAARRTKAGQCIACGYNRSGLAPEHPCPECGAATPDR